jgi:hypothetical protein
MLIISGATFAFRRKTFAALGGYHGITYAPDQWGIATRLSKSGKISFDNHLCVVTSPRSVNKPLLRIFKEGIVNWSRWDRHMFKQVVSAINRSVNKIFHKSPSTCARSNSLGNSQNALGIGGEPASEKLKDISPPK